MALDNRNALITNTPSGTPTAFFFSGILNGATKLTPALDEGKTHKVGNGCPIFELGQQVAVVNCDIKPCAMRRSLGKIASCVCIDPISLEVLRQQPLQK